MSFYSSDKLRTIGRNLVEVYLREARLGRVVAVEQPVDDGALGVAGPVDARGLGESQSPEPTSRKTVILGSP